MQPIRRRDFIRKGFIGGAAIAALPLLKRFPNVLDTSCLINNPLFSLGKEDLERLLAIALENGGDFADIYVERRIENQLYLYENKINVVSRGIDNGIGIRVINGEKTGYAYNSGDFDLKNLKETARIAAMASSGKISQKIVRLSKMNIPSHSLVHTPPESVIPKDKAKYVVDANSIVRNMDPKIVDTIISFWDINKKIIIANSEGIWVDDIQTMSELSVRVNIHRNGRTGSGWANKNGTIGFEHFSLKAAEDLGRKALAKAGAQSEAEDAPAGEFPIVLDKENCGVLFHEAIGHSLEADRIRHRSSFFWDKRGRLIASEIVTLADDGTVPGGRGSINIDDEGTLGQKTFLIEKGICTNFLFDKLNARLMNDRTTGNGRRQSYQFPPIPRMTNTYLTAGQDVPEDIIRSVKYGIFVDEIGGGNVDVTTGNFVFEATGAHLIEDGKKTKPLKSLQLIGNSPDVLMNITMVGADLANGSAGDCGKDDQIKPCGAGNPTFKVAKITVGGSKFKQG